MLLEKKSKSEKDGSSQVDNTLLNLVSSLNTLSIDETSQKDIANLECGLPKVSVEDNKDVYKNECEEETTKSKELVKAEDTTEKKLNNSSESDHSEKEDEEKEKEETGIQKETEEEEKEKESLTLNKNDVEKVDSDAKDRDVEQAKDDKEKEDSKEQSDGENEVEKDVSDSNNESSSDEAAVSVVTKKGKKLLKRGLGAGTQSDQHFQYGLYQMGYNDLQCVQPAVAPIAYAQQPMMSPQQGMSPGYSMSMSPVPGYTEPMFNNMQNGNGNLDDAMSSLLESAGMNVDLFWAPPTPPSPNRGENDCSIPQGITTDPSSFHIYDDLAEIIRNDDSRPSMTIPPADLLPILDQLADENFDNPQMMQKSMCGNDVDWLSKSEFMNLLQDNRFDYPAVLSPPAEEETVERSAEERIQQCLDDALFKKAIRRMAMITNEALTEKDSEGDNPCVVVACQDEKGPRYYENLVAMVDRARAIDICCEKPVSMERRCLSCGNTDQNTFYSPFAMLNNEGDTLLSSVIRAQQSKLVVEYICESIFLRQADVLRIFGGHNANLYQQLVPHYPVLAKGLSSF